MAGKRKLIRKRTARKTRPKTSTSTKKEEEERSLGDVKPSPKQSGTRKKRNAPVSNFADPMDNDKSTNDDDKENTMNAENDEDIDEEISEEQDHKNKFEVRQRVLARDEDGILYYANVRRKLLGVNHQKTISSLGIFDLAPDELLGKEMDTKESEGENESTTNESQENEWHYFVHYEGWKALFDRWVSEKDIMEITPENVERMKEISKAHKDFQQEFKEKTKKRKIQNGGLFLQQWKQRLDALNRRWEEKNTIDKDKEKEDKLSAAKKKRKAALAAKKKNLKSPEEVLRDRSKLAVKSCLTTRQASHIQAIPLSFALKRILVEDWENLNNASFAAENNRKEASDENLDLDMVHVLPAKVTIREALTLYLKEKGISWDGRPTKSNQNNETKTVADKETSVQATVVTQLEKEIKQAGDSSLPMTSTDTPSLPENATSNIDVNNTATKEKVDEQYNVDEENGKGISIQLVKEWTDMANGIVLYFEQALMARLLYPSEISQLLVLQDNILENETSESMSLKVDIYGCEHLLRLLASIPRILDQQLQEYRKRKLERKQQNSKQQEAKSDEDAEQEDAFVEIGSMILAKLQDLSRFLQKNQSALFRSMYRKKNEQEIKRDIKIQKRQERRLKSLVAAVAAVENLSGQEEGKASA